MLLISLLVVDHLAMVPPVSKGYLLVTYSRTSHARIANWPLLAIYRQLAVLLPLFDLFIFVPSVFLFDAYLLSDFFTIDLLGDLVNVCLLSFTPLPYLFYG